MNYYSTTFKAKCPVNGAEIKYDLRITTHAMIKVEDLMDEIALFDTVFHEEAADQLHRVFGGLQELNAHHHGVWIRTVRGQA